MISDETLFRHGWRPIVSDAQATQLMRREIKHFAKYQQRTGMGRDFRYLLAFKKGNWYQLSRGKLCSCSVMIWRRKRD